MTRPNGNQRNTSAASTQRVRETTKQMTSSQSLTLVKNLVRISISTVCHIRNIFPGTCFQERTYAGMKIYQLDAASRDPETDETVIHNQQAYQLTLWLESGVFEAVERRYLRRMELIIVNEDLNRPRETYSFDLDYPEDENDSAIVFSGTRVTTVENSKTQLVKLIRSLIQFSNTLEELPSERAVTMKLWYHEERTPTDWEPQYFEAANPDDLSFTNDGDHDTLRIRIGELRTPHHALKVRFRGVVDNPDDETEGGADGTVEGVEDVIGVKETTESGGSDGEETRMDSLCRRSKLGGLLMCEAGYAEERDEETDEDETKEPEAEPFPREHEGRGVSRVVSQMENLDITQAIPMHDEIDDSDSEDTTMMDDIRMWAKKQTRPTISGAQKQLGITKEGAQECFAKMADEGLLRKENYRYHTVAPASPAYDRDGETSSGDSDDGMQQDAALSSQDRPKSASDDSATMQIPETLQETRTTPPNTTMPPPVRLRGEGRGVTPPEGTKMHGDFVTPPVPRHTAMRGMQPVPEKPQQARILSMATKRVLDEAELSENKETNEGDPIDPYKAPDDGASVGFEVSLSQASSRSVIRTAKCSLVRQPIRQSKRQRFNVQENTLPGTPQ